MSRLSKQLTADEILQSTNGGRNIFEKEIGEIPKKCINSPLREDNNPSFSIFLANNGLWMYKDFSNGDSGTAIQFIQKLYDLDYNKAISYILGLNIHTNITHKKLIKEQPKKLIIDWVEQKFTDQHKRYFGEYELDEKFLNSRDIWALKTIALNKRIQKFPEHQFKFAYYAKDLDQIKVLTLGKEVSKDEKWRSYNIPNAYLWDYWRYKDSPCENLFVVKSNKDGAVLAKLGRCAIELQSEDAKVFLENNVEKVKLICKSPIICTGTDDQGFNTSLNITKSTGFRWFNTKKKYLKMYDINDVSGLVSVFSLKKLEQELIAKQL